MKKLLSIKYSQGAFNLAMLILRAGTAALLLVHGYDKLVHFSQYSKQFINFLGMGQQLSLALCVFAEFFCSLFLIFGLFSRLVVIPMIINMTVVVFQAHKGDIFGEGEHGMLFLIAFVTVLIVGPGKISVDGMVNK
jgi:putative oxidoreductase